jgi:hypothetical protein
MPELRPVSTSKCLDDSDNLTASFEAGHAERLGHEMGDETLGRNKDVGTWHKDSKQLWGYPQMKSQNAHSIMFRQRCESWRGLTIESVECSRQTPHAAIAVATLP